MNDPSYDSELQALGLRALVGSDGRVVAIVSKLWKEFSKFPSKDRASLVRWMEIWCEGEHHLPPERFKMLDKMDGYRIDEFKSYQARAYGTVATIRSVQTFVVTALDIKKRDDADQAVIKRAARLAAKLKLEP